MAMQASTATNARKRRAALNHVRKQVTIQYHALSAVSCDDRISTRADELPDLTGMDETELMAAAQDEIGNAVDLLSDAINCLNRELGRKEDSNALGDGTA